MRIVDDLTDYQSQQGYLMLEVPLQPDAKSTAALVHHLLARQYDTGACAQHW
ncbi:MAG: hypothetical protein M3N82_01275 [Pseudomonadota bacterium]|nr:hypothetical protein [Pseudomonadota bacterium]